MPPEQTPRLFAGPLEIMEQNDRQRASAPGEAAPSDSAESSERTRPGQIVQDLTRVTRPIPATDRRTSTQAAAAAQRDRISSLVAALGDPAHPLHQRAIDDLVAIGPPAVPQLCEALNPQRPWLTAYRAADALGRIGDGRGAGPLLDALRHPNSNVRWSAVRALASVGDARALLELRRVARSDQSKTSWGESVGGAAQSVLEQMQGRNVLLRGADLIKTATACVAMLVGLILAWSFVTALRDELNQIGRIEIEANALTPIVRTAEPTVPIPTPLPRPTSEPLSTDAVPTISSSAELLASVAASGNVRASPSRATNNVIGAVTEGDDVIVIASTADQQWYRVALGARRASSSRINSPDQTGWVARSLLTPFAGEVPVETPQPIPTAILEQPSPAIPTVPLEPPTLTPSP
jgi:hypothetical protein